MLAKVIFRTFLNAAAFDIWQNIKRYQFGFFDIALREYFNFLEQIDGAAKVYFVFEMDFILGGPIDCQSDTANLEHAGAFPRLVYENYRLRKN